MNSSTPERPACRLALLLVLTACADASPATDETSGAPATGEGSGAPSTGETTATTGAASSESGEPPPTVSYTGCVSVASIGDPGTGADGFEFSILDRPEIPSAFTDNAGCVTLAGLPPDEDLALRFTKEGFVPRIRPIHTGTADFTNPNVEYVVGAEGPPLITEWAGLPAVDPSLGQTRLYAVDASAVPDYLADIEVVTDEPLPVQCYMPHDWFELGLGSAGCASPGDNLGVLVTWNHAPVTIDMTIERGGTPCTAQFSDDGWGLSWAVPGVANTIRVPSRPGLETLTSVLCTP